MHETRCIDCRLRVISLVAVLVLTGCDISPRYPVLEGNGGRSSLTPTDEAFAEGAEATSPSSANLAPDDPPQEMAQELPADLPAQSQKIPHGAGDAAPTAVRRNYDDE